MPEVEKTDAATGKKDGNVKKVGPDGLFDQYTWPTAPLPHPSGQKPYDEDDQSDAFVGSRG
jgi:hypothetical protein